MIKKCKRCGTEYTFETDEEQSKYFYKKQLWFLNVCKQCHLKEHSAKYNDGRYNYRKKNALDKDEGYYKPASFGFY
jgi:hypothetical protein